LGRLLREPSANVRGRPERCATVVTHFATHPARRLVTSEVPLPGRSPGNLRGMAPEQPAADAVTEEERARVRAEVREKLADAAARHTPEYWVRLREQLGLPPKAA
jgi:crotonobetainyl-CoA:carnitine CoA-transferase CaiB-like acyl-CoA transferase